MTRHVVFKILHAAKDRINWFRDRFNGKIIYLVRHPIAVSLSRKSYPRLETYLESSYRKNFPKDLLDFASHIMRDGSKLEQGILDWCLENSVPLRSADNDWIIFSYEQLVLDPQPIIDTFVQKLQVPHPQKMRDRLQIPSSTVSLSDQKTQEVFSGKESQPRKDRWLVEKWREKVGPEEERRVMEILKAFDMNIYKAGEALPSDEVWLSPISK